MAPAVKTNFKTYEAQARLMRAIIAAHPEVKWNYKVIAAFFGSDMSENALEHRFRAIKAHADVVRQAREQKVDCKDVPADLPKDKKEIARMFGSSTADGIQFQFRAIKQDANTLKAAVNGGGDPASALNLGTASTASTPRGGKAAASATPSSKRSASAASRSGTSAKRTKVGAAKPAARAAAAAASDEGDDDEEEDDAEDYDALDNDNTPRASVKDRILASGRKKPAAAPAAAATYPTSIFNNPAAPVRAATANATARIAQQSVDLTTSDSEVNTPPETGPAPLPSLFGPPDAKPAAQGYGPAQEAAFRQEGVDEWVGGSSEGDSFGVPAFESFSGSFFNDEI